MMELLHMLNEFNDLSDQIFLHRFPTGESSHTCAGRKTGQWRRRGRGRAQPNEDVILPRATECNQGAKLCYVVDVPDAVRLKYMNTYVVV